MTQHQLEQILNPADYRWFAITGSLIVNGEAVPVFTGVHDKVTDLPPGEAAKAVMTERVRATVAKDNEAPETRWKHVDIYELSSEQAVFEPLPI